MLRLSIKQLIARPCSSFAVAAAGAHIISAQDSRSSVPITRQLPAPRWPATGSVRAYSVPTTQPIASSAADLAGSDGLLRKLIKKFGWSDNSRSRLRVSSYLMYQSVADQVDYKHFFDTYHLPNTFNSWFLVTELHVWLLLVRAMAEGAESGEDGRFMRNCIVEAMWADVNTRAKKLGDQNPGGVRNQIQVLSQQFQAALITYDEGLTGDDVVLAGALWRRFFELDCDDYALLERMVTYVRFQVRLLDGLSRHDFAVRPRIAWTLPVDESAGK